MMDDDDHDHEDDAALHPAWAVLGLAPTPDARAVKRAYAQRLKQQRAHDDPQAFTRLREAYAWALAQCGPLRRAGPRAEESGGAEQGPEASTVGPETGAPLSSVRAEPAEAPALRQAPGEGVGGEVPDANAHAAPAAAEPPAQSPQPHGHPPWVQAWQAQAQARVTLARRAWGPIPPSLAELDATIARAHHDTQLAHPMPAVLALEEAWARYWCQGPQQGVAPSEGQHLSTALGLGQLAPPPFTPAEPLPRPQWLLLGQALCDHYGWGHTPSPQGQAVAAQLRQAWATHLNEQGLQDPAAATQQLHTLWPRALWQVPAQRQALGQAVVEAWAKAAAQATSWGRPTWNAWAQTLLDETDALHTLAARRSPAQAALCEAWLCQQDGHLLQRVASGEQEHPHIPRPVAQALLAPQVRAEDRKAVMAEGHWRDSGLPWQAVVRQTLAWLATHAPEALNAVQPEVLAWWQRHHVQEHWSWPLAAMAAGFSTAFSAAGAAKDAMAGAPGADFLVILSWCLGLAVGALAGWWGAALLAELRLRWACGPYQRWQAWDARLAARIAQALPWWPQALRSPRWGWSRHGLPMASVFVQQWVSLAAQPSHPSAPPDAWWELPLIALVITLFVGWLWSGLITRLGRP